MFKCSRCGAEHSRYRERAKIRPASYCAACHAANMAATRPKHIELNERQRKAQIARKIARVYVGRGKLIQGPCQHCGDLNSEGHHPDYSKPLDVIWLCREHHLALHAGELEVT